MIISGMMLYHSLVWSGVLLDGTWKSTDSEIKTDGKTAEFFADKTASSAVLNILDVDDMMLSRGRIVYRCELCFERVRKDAVIIYENHGGIKLIEVTVGEDSEIFLFE